MRLLGHWMTGAGRIPRENPIHWRVRLNKESISKAEPFLWRGWSLWCWGFGRYVWIRTPFYPGPNKAKMARRFGIDWHE